MTITRHVVTKGGKVDRRCTRNNATSRKAYATACGQFGTHDLPADSIPNLLLLAARGLTLSAATAAELCPACITAMGDAATDPHAHLRYPNHLEGKPAGQ
jgi:hypothetical protein